ncbi:MAG: hypothetical protein R8K54_06420 [Mariprofundaceae bacterium]
MALTVHPTDGFINRLLQQTTRPAAQPVAEKRSDTDGKDQVSISSQARQTLTSSPPDTQLESKLLQMYNQNGDRSS